MRDQVTWRWPAWTLLRLSLVVVAASFSGFSAFGQQGQGGNCSLAGTEIIFLNYSPLTTIPLDASPVFYVKCSNNISSVELELSAGGSGSVIDREMDGLAKLSYNVYTEASASPGVIWGDGTPGTTTKIINDPDPAGNGTAVPIYARIPAGMDVPAGMYSDILTVSMISGGKTESATITVRANVIESCTVNSFTLNFGNYDPVTTHRTQSLDAMTVITAHCTTGTEAKITLSNGDHFDGTNRRMMEAGSPPEYLSYNIFTDSGRSMVWDNVVGVTEVSDSRIIPLGGGGGIPAYGRILGGQNVRAGNYTDTVVATVNY